MYEGFVGPIPFLHWFITMDGEASYDLTEYEMFIHIGVLTLVFINLRAIIVKKKRSVTSAT